MASSRRPGLIGREPFAPSPHTPGLLGVGDAVAPSALTRLIGNTPGLLGRNDWADPALSAANHFAPFARSQRQHKTLSEHAETKLWDLYKNHENQVGSHRAQWLKSEGLPDDTAGKEKTDCITYVIQVLSYAFERTAKNEAARRVRRLGERGTELAAYLVNLGWKAYYWNPDVVNAEDGEAEHSFSYKLAKRSKTYYNTPVSGFIINYRPTPVPAPKKATEKDMTAFDRFSKVKFAYGLARGGKHTFMCSYGMIFEVHWEAIGENLYESSEFYKFEWNSGIMVVPPDSDYVA